MPKVKDSMGTMEVPDDAYYGASTARAILNFPISGYTIPASILKALAHIKLAAARTNRDLGLLPDDLFLAVEQAAQEGYDGRFKDQFPVDVFQTGSGTSTNMNMNEVIAARANEILGSDRHARHPVHPNDHINLGQSSNDVIPSAIHIAARLAAGEDLLPSMKELADSLDKRAKNFADIVKVGRTHMQDAVPVTLGQEFSGYSAQVREGIRFISATFPALEQLPLGGTAVGTGLNTHPRFAVDTVELIATETGTGFTLAENRFASMGGKDALTAFHKAMSSYASSLYKIASDIRFLASGPYTGIGEINIPSLQPGSSIMPGKVNPVVPESVLQVATRIMGNDTTITIANSSGNLELNVMMPLMGFVIMESLALLANATLNLSEKCVDRITANEDRCKELVERSLALVTPLVRKIGYDKASDLAKEAQRTGKTLREIPLGWFEKRVTGYRLSVIGNR
jgi:fumarate hydratase class II